MTDLKKALAEDAAARNILNTLYRIQHFKMLEKKYGPRQRVQEERTQEEMNQENQDP